MKSFLLFITFILFAFFAKSQNTNSNGGVSNGQGTGEAQVLQPYKPNYYISPEQQRQNQIRQQQIKEERFQERQARRTVRDRNQIKRQAEKNKEIQEKYELKQMQNNTKEVNNQQKSTVKSGKVVTASSNDELLNVFKSVTIEITNECLGYVTFDSIVSELYCQTNIQLPLDCTFDDFKRVVKDITSKYATLKIYTPWTLISESKSFIVSYYLKTQIFSIVFRSETKEVVFSCVLS